MNLARQSFVMISVAVGCADPIPCPDCAAPTNVGAVTNVELAEISGVAASGKFGDVVYAHNDSGDSARFFALSTAGADLATYEVQNASNKDWEDIALADCASGSCLYIADIGDNDLTRTKLTIYLVAEPAMIEPGLHSLPSDEVEFSYPDGPHDAEVLLVHPRTGVVTLVTKAESGPAAIYQLPTLTPGGQLMAERVGELEPPDGKAKFTGGSVRPDGTGILLRTNSRLFHYEMTPEQTVADVLAGDACQLELADEVQGEAVTWLSDGSFVTLGEGQHAAVNLARCTSH